MKAVVYHKPRDMRVEDVPDARIEHPTDAVVRVTLAAICGSDLHFYNGLIPQMRPQVVGHEFMGIVEEVGPEVTKLAVGDRVIVPFPIACGYCWFCNHHWPTQCENSNKEMYGPEGGVLHNKGGALFGYSDLYGGYQGGMAEAARVPYADVGPLRVPDYLSDEQVIFLTDILPTAWTGIEWVQPVQAQSVAVFGCGPVGLATAKVAFLKGADQVIAVDVEPYRLELAKRVAPGVETIDVSGDVKAEEVIWDLTEGRGTDVAIDCVGMEVSRPSAILGRASDLVHGQAGSINGLKSLLRSVRRGGRVSILGVYATDYDNFPLGQIFDKGLTIHAGQALAQNYVADILADIEEGRLQADDIITHRLPLEQAPSGFEIFNRKEDGCVKVVLKP